MGIVGKIFVSVTRGQHHWNVQAQELLKRMWIGKLTCKPYSFGCNKSVDVIGHKCKFLYFEKDIYEVSQWWTKIVVAYIYENLRAIFVIDIIPVRSNFLLVSENERLQVARK